MKINLTCRDAARLILAGEDRPLGAGERATLRMHLLICKGCSGFVRQVEFMRTAMERWREDPERGATPAAREDPPPDRPVS